jgi:molybdopterin/thiamine biosynthesis adenylyltransferase
MINRYCRQTILSDVGPIGQARLRDARVLIVGAGGLGCAILQYLCAAGVGQLTVVDHDRVEESNLHRQPIYRMSDVGLLKVQAARSALLQANPEIEIEPVSERLTPTNASALIASADLIVDAADNFAVTYVLSDESHRVTKRLVSGSVLGMSGYVGAFCGGAPSYRALFPDLPRYGGTCAQSGVLGTAVGVIGTLQAHMVLALLLGLQPTVLGRLVTIDFRSMRFGGFSFSAAQEPSCAAPFISVTQVGRTDVVIDLRSASEASTSPLTAALRMGIDDVVDMQSRISREQRVVLCCRTGIRAAHAARTLQSRGHQNVALIALGD